MHGENVARIETHLG